MPKYFSLGRFRRLAGLEVGAAVLIFSSACDDEVLYPVATPDAGPADVAPPARVPAPSPPAPAPPPEPPPPPPEPTCEDALTETFELVFAARSGCAFSSAGNLEPREGFLQARRDEARPILLPPIRTLCDLALRSREGPPIAFDDEVVVLVEDVVLVAGGSGLALDEYPTVDGLPRFDWAAVRGASFRPRDAPYRCLGGGPCAIPRTEELGELSFAIDAATMGAIAEALDLLGSFRVRFVTFGDNDPSDCAHGDLRFDLEVRYLP
jgi:hypothetical protein